MILQTATGSAGRGARLVCALVLPALLAAGCPPRTPKIVHTPAQRTGGGAAEEVFAGKSPEEARRLMAGALARPVSLTLRDAPLEEALAELGERTGFGVGVDPRVWAACRTRPINLAVRDMEARHALEWVARLLDAWYAVEGGRTILFTDDPDWAGRGRLETHSYGIGSLRLIRRPVRGSYKWDYEAQRFILLLRSALAQTMQQPAARIVPGRYFTAVSANLPPRGHDKLARIIEEVRRPRTYRPPARREPPRSSDLLATRVVCNVARGDVRDAAARLARAAGVNIGFDYRAVPRDRRRIALALGETRLDRAVAALSEAAGLGRFHLEPGRRIWILARDEGAASLLETGALPWDASVVRSYYVGPLARRFGAGMVFRRVQGAVADGLAVVRPIAFYHISGDRLRVERLGRRPPKPGAADAAPPVGLYHAATGRLVLIHSDAAQQLAGRAIEELMKIVRAPRGRED